MAETRRTSITLDAEIEEVIKRMMRYHMAESISEYFRGLVMLDFLLVKGRADYKSLPSWLLRGYPLTFLSEVRAKMLKEWAEKMTPIFSKRIRARVQQLIKDGKVDLTTKEVPEFVNEISEAMAEDEDNSKKEQ
jgi:hypothetical protein